MQVSDFTGKTVFITGGSRGIGLAIAMRLARAGANLVIAAKTVEPDSRLPGTIHSAAEKLEEAGGKALPLQVDIRDETQIASAMEKAAKQFGGIDMLVNNASAISLTGTEQTPMKKFDLMFSVNVRGTFASSQAAIPYLRNSENPHILNLSPPLSMRSQWFKNHVAYTMAKYGMSMCVLGMAEEFREEGIAVNALWPKTAINTAAIAMLGGLVKPENCRSPEIVADAAFCILKRKSRECSGHFFIDDEVLSEEGISDFSRYELGPEEGIFQDFFID